MARSKDKHQINVSVAENVKAIYQAMSDVSGMNSRVVQAGMIWLLEHPEKRQEAMDRLGKLYSRSRSGCRLPYCD